MCRETLRVKKRIIKEAKRLQDPMSSLQHFQHFNSNGLRLTISCTRVAHVLPKTISWAFELVKSNMKSLYEESEWGWKDKVKMKEMTHKDTWYVVAVTESSQPVGFASFRFDFDVEFCVLYCYEIHVEKETRKFGLGKFLMRILEEIARRAKMEKVMLTVFKKNLAARKFYQESLGYTPDDLWTEEETDYDFTYLVLSKQLGN